MILLSTSLNCAAIDDGAKNIDYTPDITSDAYWDEHNVGLVRVTNIAANAEGKQQVTLTLIRPISAGPMEETKTVPISHLWFGPPEEGRPVIEVRTLLVIYSAKVSPSPTVAAVVQGDPDKSQLVNRLNRIAGLHADRGGFGALTEGVFDPDQPVELYCLRRLLKGSPFPPPAGYLEHLHRLRDNEGSDSQVRLLASDLANKLESKPADSDETYSWLKKVIGQDKVKEWTQLRPFVDRLLDFASKRPETVSFLCELAQDGKQAEATRIAAYSAFDDSRLFRFARPDAESDMVFNACVEMVKDQQPVMRRAGAALLYNISVRINPEAGRNYVVRAKTAIAAAMRVEGDEGTSSQMKMYLNLLSQRD